MTKEDAKAILEKSEELAPWTDEQGGMAEGSVMHRLALRLMDYINRL
jgi:hypothetical protein